MQPAGGELRGSEEECGNINMTYLTKPRAPGGPPSTFSIQGKYRSGRRTDAVTRRRRTKPPGEDFESTGCTFYQAESSRQAAPEAGNIKPHKFQFVTGPGRMSFRTALGQQQCSNAPQCRPAAVQRRPLAVQLRPQAADLGSATKRIATMKH
ncbi:unnamed protein product [Gadus morhua 'NCC']